MSSLNYSNGEYAIVNGQVVPTSDSAINIPVRKRRSESPAKIDERLPSKTAPRSTIASVAQLKFDRARARVVRYLVQADAASRLPYVDDILQQYDISVEAFLEEEYRFAKGEEDGAPSAKFDPFSYTAVANRLERVMLDLVRYFRIPERLDAPGTQPEDDLSPFVFPDEQMLSPSTGVVKSGSDGSTNTSAFFSHDRHCARVTAVLESRARYVSFATKPTFDRKDAVCMYCGMELLNPAEKRKHEDHVHRHKAFQPPHVATLPRGKNGAYW